MIRRLFALAAGVGLSVAASCQPSPVDDETFPALHEHEMRKVAVAPLVVTARVAGAANAEGVDARVASTIVAHQTAEALSARGLEIVAPIDMQRALERRGLDSMNVSVPDVARTAREEFGADTLLFGALTRWSEREGSAQGATRPAAVGFTLTLRDTASGRRLWSGTFDERQKPLGENVLVTSQYPGGGTRWLTAEELARWGARRLVDAIPLPPR